MNPADDHRPPGRVPAVRRTASNYERLFMEYTRPWLATAGLRSAWHKGARGGPHCFEWPS